MFVATIIKNVLKGTCIFGISRKTKLLNIYIKPPMSMNTFTKQMPKKTYPELADELFLKAESDAKYRYNRYVDMSKLYQKTEEAF